MKLKIWKVELEFDEKDAKIVIPILLGGMASKWSVFDNRFILLILVIYYALYFYLNNFIQKCTQLRNWFKFKCPGCKSRKIILQGYQGYRSEEQHAYYLCTECETSALMTEDGLTHRQTIRQQG